MNRIEIMKRFGNLVRAAIRALILSGLLFCCGSATAQTTATYIGPNNGNWSNPANWDIGVVPINNGGNTYNVIVPAGKIVNFDLSGSNTIAGINLSDSGRINVGSGSSLNVSGFALVAGLVYANGPASSFDANSGLASFQPSPQLHATNGSFIRVNGADFQTNAGLPLTGTGTIVGISSTGQGSFVDLSSVNTFTNRATNANGGGTFRVDATDNGIVDLRNVQVIDSGWSTSQLSFYMRSGGQIDLSNLTQITALSADSSSRASTRLDI